jgi:hypothetical protein
MNGEGRRRGAAVLLAFAWALWLHPWVPALLVGGGLAWIILHKRVEAQPDGALVRVWRRVWPPETLVLIPALLASTFVFWSSNVRPVAKVLPIALGMLGLATCLQPLMPSFGRPGRQAAPDVKGSGG